MFSIFVVFYSQGQMEDHGPFKSLSKLWQHSAHLAVFMNYVLSNCDPSSLVSAMITLKYNNSLVQ
jgi:hypothetical protein